MNLIAVSLNISLPSVKTDGGCRIGLGVDVVKELICSNSIPLLLLLLPIFSPPKTVKSNAGLEGFFMNMCAMKVLFEV